MKFHPLLDPAHARAAQTRLIEGFAPGMKRRNLQKVVDARGQFLADERGMLAANQYGCNSLRHVMIERDGFVHGHFRVEPAASADAI